MKINNDNWDLQLQFARWDIKVREDLMGEALIQIRRVVECVTSLAKEAERLKFWINPSTQFAEEWMEFLRRLKGWKSDYRRWKNFQEQVTQGMKNLRDDLEKSQENLLSKLEDKLTQLLSKATNSGKGNVQEIPEEDSSSLPRKPQETSSRFVFSAGGLQSNVHNPTNLPGASGSNMWASSIKTDVPNFNDPIELEKLKEEQSKDFGATDDKFKHLEERIKAMEGTDAFIGTDAMELSLVPDLILPPNFKVPEFEKFDGTSCPNAHLTMFCRKMTGYENDDKLLIHCFQDSLIGSDMRWYNQLSKAQVSTWRELACAFKEHYKHVLDMVPDRLTLQNIGKKDKESFREYAQRWRDVAAQVQPPLLEKETTTLFINSLESTPMYYARLVGSTTRDFADLVSAGKAIECAIKSGKLNDPEASKKIHSKRRETEFNMVGSDRRSYTNYQPSPQIIYPTTYSKHVADPSGQHTQSQGEPKSLKASKEKQTFTSIPIPYKDLFANLLEERLISPIFLTSLQPPYPAWYDPSAHCEYHAGIPRHSIENCMAFKRRVQHLINQNVIQLNTSQGPNVANNPLPAHDKPRVNVVTSDNGTKIKTNISEVLSPLKWVWEMMIERGLRVPSQKSEDEIPVEGTSSVKVLHITTHCHGHILPHVLVDNGSALNVMPMSTLNRLPVDKAHLRPCHTSVRAFDGTKREVVGKIDVPLLIGPTTYNVEFTLMDITPTYNCLLGRPWIHAAGAVPSTLHQKVKFVIDGRLISVGAEEDIIASTSTDAPYIDVDENAIECTFRSLEFVNATFVVERKKISKPRLSKNTLMGVRLTPNPRQRMKKILRMKEQRRARLIGQSIEKEPMQFPRISETFVSGGHIHSEGGKKKTSVMSLEMTHELSINAIGEDDEIARSRSEIRPCPPGCVLNNWTDVELPIRTVCPGECEFDNGYEDYELTPDLLRLLEQENKEILPHQESIETINLGTNDAIREVKIVLTSP
ncbi:hypothetical protein GQ457_01G014900 [Hibiscus cannabinus]